MTTNQETFQQRVEAAWGGSPTWPYNLHRMGDDQWSMLSSMCEHGGWSDGAGWTWSNRSSTIKLADSLVKRGLLIREDRTVANSSYIRPRFTPNPTIAAIYAQVQRERDQANHARWAEQEHKQAVAAQDRKANEFALAKLIEAHPEQYEAWVEQYHAEHPVES